MSVNDVVVRVDWECPKTGRLRQNRYTIRLNGSGGDLKRTGFDAVNEVYSRMSVDKKTVRKMPVIGIYPADENRITDWDISTKHWRPINKNDSEATERKEEDEIRAGLPNAGKKPGRRSI